MLSFLRGLLVLLGGVGLSLSAASQESNAFAAFQTLATTDKNGLEGMIVAGDGSIYVTDASEHVIHKIDRSGQRTIFTTLPFVPQVVVLADAGFVVTGQYKEPDFSPPKAGEPPRPPKNMDALDAVVATLDRSGKVTSLTRGRPGCFFNGLARAGKYFLIADSTAATIWRFDPSAKSVEPWLTDAALKGADGRFPGANGLKVVGDKVYVANTSAGNIYRIKIGRDGGPEGALAKYVTVNRPDDFDVDSRGNVYLPSEGHVLKISPTDQPMVIAEGCTGCDAALLTDRGHSLLLVTHGFGPNAGAGRVLTLKLPGS
jgi:sugar lactone lactonase YvrE